MTLLFLFLAFVAINVATISYFWADKERSKNARRRIPERRLLGLALLGGTPGAYLARRMFDHKTRKQPFSRHLATIAAVQAGVVAVLLLILPR